MSVALLLASGAWAQGTSVLTGTVTDAATNKPVPDVVVTATSPAMQGEQIVVTDAAGQYRIAQLPPGIFQIRLEKEGFKVFTRGDIAIRVDRTVRVNVSFQPEALVGDEIVVVGRAPTVDVGSTQQGVVVNQDFLRSTPLIRPGEKNSGVRSFESLAEVAPGVNADDYGYSINGATSPENQFVIDGVSVNDPAYGTIGTPLSVEFVGDVNVITGGYMPEYGRATGGVMNVVTKTGSNEFHGSVWGNWAPGAFEPGFCTDSEGRYDYTGGGFTCRTPVRNVGSAFTRQTRNWNTGDFGFDIGGPIIKDKLWFYAGFNPSFARFRVTKDLTAQDPESPNGENRLSSTNYFADQRSLQYIAKLTWQPVTNHNLSLSIYGTPTSSGGPGQPGIDYYDNTIDNVATGTDSAAFSRYQSEARDIGLKYQGSFLDKKVLLDVSLGWHHQAASNLPSDGSNIGDTTGNASRPQIIFRRDDPTFHNLGEFVPLTAEQQAACRGVDEDGKPVEGGRCLVNTYAIGGAGFMETLAVDRLQARAVGTVLFQLLGHHVVKAGVDVELMSYEHTKAYSGGTVLRESTSGETFRDFQRLGYVTGPDEDVLQTKYTASSKSTTLGGFVQDSWNVADLVTLNVGVRYDQQSIFGNDGALGMVLNNQISPRVGLVYDFTQQGHSKVYANFGRYYESVPLDIADRAFPGERQAGYVRVKDPSGTESSQYSKGNYYGTGTPRGCDPLKDESQATNECLDENNKFVLGYGHDPSQYVYLTGGDRMPVDPNLQPQSSDEIVVGGEYEVISDGRLGVNYTRRYMVNVIEDMSRDEGNTYFIGNPGYGLARDFPKATRDYDAVNVYFTKAFSDQWLAQVSYTWSYLRGNYSGLYRPETLQLDPNISADFDQVSLLQNRDGPLPADRTHVIKVFGAKEFQVSPTLGLSVGAAYKGRSGTPINYLGSHVSYGPDEAFVLPRGSGGRTPWEHTIDARLGVSYRFNKDNVATLSVDFFNLFNFQAVQRVDQTFTQSDVKPSSDGANPQQSVCIAGKDVCTEGNLNQFQDPDGNPLSSSAFNPNFKNPTVYQAPRSIRLGLRVSF